MNEAPTMSQFASRSACLEARDVWFQERYEKHVAALEQIARLSSEGEVSAQMQFALGDIARAALTA